MSDTAPSPLAEQIVKAILAGEYRPGERLDEAALAARFNISRTPIREALMQVCALGLAQRRPNRGVEVIRPDAESLLEQFEALAEIEALCASLAAHRATLAQMIALETLLGDMETALPEHYGAKNFDLHKLIGEMAGNRELLRMAEGLSLRLALFRQAQLARQDRQDQSRAEHRALVEAICNRDAASAQHIMRRHLRRAAAESLQLLN